MPLVAFIKQTLAALVRRPLLLAVMAGAAVAPALLLGGSAQATGSAKLYLAPATGNYTVGQTITVRVMADTGGDPVNAVEADLSYPVTKLQFQSIDATSSAFNIAAEDAGGRGTVAIARGNITPVTGTAQVTTVRFVVLAAGAAPVRFLNSSAVVRSTDNINVLTTATGADYVLATVHPAPSHPSHKRPVRHH